MDAAYYRAIFKRKSFHLFQNVGSDLIEKAELENIETGRLLKK